MATILILTLKRLCASQNIFCVLLAIFLYAAAAPDTKERQAVAVDEVSPILDQTSPLERWKSDPSVSNTTRHKRQYVMDSDSGELRLARYDCAECLCKTFNTGNGLRCETAPVCGPCYGGGCGTQCYCTAFQSNQCYWYCDYPGGLNC